MQAFIAKYAAWLLGAAVIFGAGAVSGWMARNGQVQTARAATATAQARYDSAVADAALRLAKVQKAADDAVTEAEARAAAARAKVEVVTKEVIKNVPVFITPETDKRYALPRGLVCVCDAAATCPDTRVSGAPESACQSPDSPSTVTASELATWVVTVCGEYYKARAEVQQLQDFYRAQQKALSAP